MKSFSTHIFSFVGMIALVALPTPSLAATATSTVSASTTITVAPPENGNATSTDQASTTDQTPPATTVSGGGGYLMNILNMLNSQDGYWPHPALVQTVGGSATDAPQTIQTATTNTSIFASHSGGNVAAVESALSGNSNANTNSYASYTNSSSVHTTSNSAPGAPDSGGPDAGTGTTSPDNVIQSTTTPSITLHWTTDVPATSILVYSTSTVPIDLASPSTPSIVDTSLTTDHAITLTGLYTGTSYNMVMQSRDKTGALILSDFFHLDVNAASTTAATSTSDIETIPFGNSDSNSTAVTSTTNNSSTASASVDSSSSATTDVETTTESQSTTTTF